LLKTIAVLREALEGERGGGLASAVESGEVVDDKGEEVIEEEEEGERRCIMSRSSGDVKGWFFIDESIGLHHR